MQKKLSKTKNIKLKNADNFIYLEKNWIIQDRFCPKCNKPLIDNTDFCKCGFFLKANRNSFIWGGVLSIWFIIGILLLISFLCFDKMKISKPYQIMIKKTDFNSLSPINIQVITSLKNSSYDDYIQNIYVKPKEEHKLVILIKPSLWNTLTSKEKKDLLNQVSENWKILYKEKYPDSPQEPQVYFANN
jgi:hypothetical protein